MNEQRVPDYLTDDFSLSGEAHRHLLVHVEDESKSDLIKLTDHVGRDPANLTPAMQQWYAGFVSGGRQAALDKVETHAARISKQAGAAGIFLERELDAIEDRKVAQKRGVLTAHYDRHRADADRLAHLDGDAQRARRQYDNLHAQHNRSPRQVPGWYVPMQPDTHPDRGEAGAPRNRARARENSD